MIEKRFEIGRFVMIHSTRASGFGADVLARVR